MTPLEMCEAVEELVRHPFDPQTFPYDLLRAYDFGETSIQKLQASGSSSSNKSRLPGGIRDRRKAHILIVDKPKTLNDAVSLLLEAEGQEKQKVRFIIASDGEHIYAEDLKTGDVCNFTLPELPEHFGFFLPLANIERVGEISESAVDIRATARLNRLYMELIKANPDWKEGNQRREMNRFLVKLIFCFYAEDTGIFPSDNVFTNTIEQMCQGDSSQAQTIIQHIFTVMSTENDTKQDAWLHPFPYVGGTLFSGSNDVPHFSRSAYNYLLSIGRLNWKEINPDVFGSMIQAVASDEERANFGVHYTSVPNILKLLNPLFLDDLRHKLEKAKGSPRALLNLRRRIAKIRVFDPACGSGNFLSTAYKQLRAIENEINICRGEQHKLSEIPLTNFRGIEIQNFAAEIARLSLLIAQFQCDTAYLSQKEAINRAIPLDEQNWIINGNALKLNWNEVCPSENTEGKITSEDLFDNAEQNIIDFEQEGGEVYICSNPPFGGGDKLDAEQKQDLIQVFTPYRKKLWRLDYVSAWFIRAAEYCKNANAKAALVATNSICQGTQVAMLWPYIQKNGCSIIFAHQSFKWKNLARNNAGVTVVIIGLSACPATKRLFMEDENEQTIVKAVSSINYYLQEGSADDFVDSTDTPLFGQQEMVRGDMPTDDGHLSKLSREDVEALNLTTEQRSQFVRRLYGSEEFINDKERWCLWLTSATPEEIVAMPKVAERVEKVRQFRLASTAKSTREYAFPALFRQIQHQESKHTIIIPRVSSERREYVLSGIKSDCIVSDSAFALYDAPLWMMAIIVSRLHFAWASTVCGKLETRLRYNNTLGWHTFPIPQLTERQMETLTQSAERILEIRESYFPKTLADLYDPETMPEDLRAAHDANDEIVERVYIGRRFKTDSERLQHLFALYADKKKALVKEAAEKAVVAPKKTQRRKKQADDLAQSSLKLG